MYNLCFLKRKRFRDNLKVRLEYIWKLSLQAQVGTPVRKYRIFMCMLPKEDRMYPLQVVVTATARVLDFIGLICYKYASEHPDHNLKFVTNSTSRHHIS